MKHWRTNLGGSIQSIGTGLSGYAITVGFTNMEQAERFYWMIPLGYILKLVGEQVSALFAADARVVTNNLNEQRYINRGTEVMINEVAKDNQ